MNRLRAIWHLAALSTLACIGAVLALAGAGVRMIGDGINSGGNWLLDRAIDLDDRASAEAASEPRPATSAPPTSPDTSDAMGGNP